MSDDRFSGKGFSDDELKPDERASLRHRNYEFDQTIGPALWFFDFLLALPKLAKVFTVAAALGGAAAFGINQGWF